MLRKLKLSYQVYNFFQKRALAHNLEPYRQLGINKTYFAPVSSADFVGKSPDHIPSDHAGISLSETELYRNLTAPARASFDAWDENGYGVLPGYLTHEQVEDINATIESLRASNELDFTYGKKLMFAVRKSPTLAGIWTKPSLLEFLNVLIQGQARLFQSINFLQGSEQRTHSDSIHMTTFPLGGLLGVWVALEDIGPDQGPLHYYPGSHKMPYYLNDAYGNEGGWLTLGEKLYTDYEEMIAEKVTATDYRREVFLANKGDVFIWHANLLHGGEPHRNPKLTRKSMVLHYFDARRVCYHEITQRPALFADL